MFTPKLTHDFWERLKDASDSLDVSCSRNCCADYLERIGHLERLIAGIKCHLNTHVPVSCLPPEILSQIFMHYAHPVHSDGTYQDSKSYITLLNIGQVCRRWRQTVLGDPRLWTHVPAHSLPAASAFLERSRGLPLTIWGNVLIPGENRSLRPMGDLNIPMECVQSISFNIAESPFQASYFIFPSHPAPQLRFLRLSFDIDKTPIALGSLPFRGDAPLLDTVILQSVLPSWTWVEMLCGITTLVINNPMPIDGTLEDVRTIISALHKMPNLVRLELCSEQWNFPPDLDLNGDEGGDDPNYLSPATLPHLRKLCLRSFAPGVYHLMARLSFPQTAYVDLTSEEFADETDIVYLSVALARHYALQLDASSISRLKSLSVRMLSSQSFAVHIASDSLQPFNDPPLPTQPLLTLNMPDTELECGILLPIFIMHLLDTFTDSLQEHFSLDTLIIDAYVVHTGTHFEKCHWMSYPRLSIARIMLIGAFVESFAAAFASQVSIAESQAHEAESQAHEAESQAHEAESQAHEAGCLCLPFLEQLEVHQFNFIFSGTTFRDIVTGLKRRKMLFGPDQGALRVGIRDCIIRARQVEGLRATCDHFEWDGKTNCVE